MTLPEHEYATAERKRREDEIWNAAIEECAASLDFKAKNVAAAWLDGPRVYKIGVTESASHVRTLKRPTS